MGLELYLDLLSQPCRAVYLFAKANRIPFEMQNVELFRGEHMTDEFARVNSLKRLPAMKDGDFTLAESAAILHYLSQKYNTPAHWYPRDLQARARVEEYLYWHADSIRGTLGSVLWIQVLGPLIDIHVPKEKVDRNRAFITQLLQHLEQKFLQDKPFLTGDQISVADLMALEELMQTFYAGFDVFEGRPKLAAWRGRVEATFGEELWQETHEAIRKLCADPKSLKDIPLAMQEGMKLRLSKIP
ncbi:glutathione S-transferase theta-2-like isoform X2 [Phascolarctos cinereus]|uniref:glutathione transferase n=1 Tax=Phascolarctos cinereus TaxID=38626 RepID=A0A6P5JSR8_PHACI|nr:glutathione S-transferase theta-2-like isoform X2 [Phascolarctos cinereus]XP_020834406.1 glutathione S-transferase theta-2-like isoform X2 [Phascolarctos cinereus]